MWISRLSLFFVLLITSKNIASENDCKGHGEVVDGTCVCDVGWSGNICQHCSGRILVGGENGSISDGEYDYMRFVGCGWKIEQEPEYSTRTLKISIDRDISCDSDNVQLRIYDGQGEFSPLLASYSGLIAPGDEAVREIIASSGEAFLVFSSNGVPVITRGYTITYEYTTEDYEVDSVQVSYVTAPSADSDWTRYHWQNLTAQGRGSSTVTVVDGFAYVYSGQILGDEFKREQMLRINTDDFTVQAIETSTAPVPRFGHSAVPWQDSILVYGGLKLDDYSITNEFWMFNVTSQTWSEVLTSVEGLNPTLFGHTAHLVKMSDGRELMIVIFGFNLDWRFSNFVFQIDVTNIENITMERVETSGAIPQAAFGHGSALDPATNQIYVLGGWKYDNSLKNDFYVFDVESSSWKIMHPIPSNPRYLHSMVFMDGLILVHGGRDVVGAENCEVPSFQIYNIESGSWKEVNASQYPRFGHSAIANESSSVMSLYGGFDGIMNSDVITYKVGTDRTSCDNLTETECLASLNCSISNGSCTELNCTFSSRDCSSLCESLGSCTDCLSTSIPCCQCTYWKDCNQPCSNVEDGTCNGTSDIGNCFRNQTMDHVCQSLKTCSACTVVGDCYWAGTACRQGNETSNCPNSILDITECVNCTHAGYTWCETTSTCLLGGDLDILYPYDTCTDVRETPDKCGDPCSVYTNCDACHSGDLMCGWCSENNNTGLGLCMSGTFDSPLSNNTCNGDWKYQICPDCQCNGHSTCVNDTVCDDCDSGTTGDTCQSCLDGFYGYPVNGVNCSECQCNGHADTCNDNGICSCNVYGISGDNCERCRLGMSGDAVNSTCYYNIDPGYRYQFTLPSSISRMNFDICPGSSIDLLVTIDSGGSVLVDEYYDATFTFNDSSSENETLLAQYTNKTYVQLVLRDSTIHFGGRDQTCVHIYMSFNPGITFYIQLEEVPFNIVLLIAIVAAVFLVLLIAVAIVWKLQSIWMRYNRRRQREVELQEMAERPYAYIDFDFSGVCEDEKNATHFVGQSVNGGNETVGSILLWIPFGNDDHEREPMIAVGTALVKSKTAPKEKPKRVLPTKRNRRSRNSGFDNPVMEDIESRPSTQQSINS